MTGCSNAEETDLYAWLKDSHGRCGQESECALLSKRLHALHLDTPEENRQNGDVFSVTRPSGKAAAEWGRERGSDAETQPMLPFQPLAKVSGLDRAAETPGEDLNPSMTTQTNKKTGKVSDGDKSAGRISPGTFRLWTTGCAKTDASDEGIKMASQARPYACYTTPDESTATSASSASSGM
jgi:hypothetical protein